MLDDMRKKGDSQTGNAYVDIVGVKTKHAINSAREKIESISWNDKRWRSDGWAIVLPKETNSQNMKCMLGEKLSDKCRLLRGSRNLEISVFGVKYRPTIRSSCSNEHVN